MLGKGRSPNAVISDPVMGIMDRVAAAIFGDGNVANNQSPYYPKTMVWEKNHKIWVSLDLPGYDFNTLVITPNDAAKVVLVTMQPKQYDRNYLFRDVTKQPVSKSILFGQKVNLNKLCIGDFDDGVITISAPIE